MNVFERTINKMTDPNMKEYFESIPVNSFLYQITNLVMEAHGKVKDVDIVHTLTGLRDSAIFATIMISQASIEEKLKSLKTINEYIEDSQKALNNRIRKELGV